MYIYLLYVYTILHFQSQGNSAPFFLHNLLTQPPQPPLTLSSLSKVLIASLPAHTLRLLQTCGHPQENPPLFSSSKAGGLLAAASLPGTRPRRLHVLWVVFRYVGVDHFHIPPQNPQLPSLSNQKKEKTNLHPSVLTRVQSDRANSKFCLKPKKSRFPVTLRETTVPRCHTLLSRETEFLRFFLYRTHTNCDDPLLQKFPRNVCVGTGEERIQENLRDSSQLTVLKNSKIFIKKLHL